MSATKLAENRVGRICLHLLCLMRDGRLGWHMAGVWRELQLPLP